jgi:hypothetical protein
MVVVMAAITVIMVVMVMVVTAAAMIVIMVMFMFAITMIVIMVMFMFAIAMIVIMVMFMLAIAMIVIMVMFMLTIAVIVVMMMFVTMIVVTTAGAGFAFGVDHLLQFFFQGVNVLHGSKDGGAVQLIPGSSNNGSGGVLLHDKRYSRCQLGIRALIGVAHNNASGILYLVTEKLAEILHVHLALARIHHGGIGIQLGIFQIGILHRLDDVRQLAHARGLDEDAVGGVFCHNLLQCLAEIAHKGAADAARIDFVYCNARFGKKAAVNDDFTKFVFNQYQFFAHIGFFDQFFNKSGLSGAQKAGEYIDFRHFHSLPNTVSRRFMPHLLL